MQLRGSENGCLPEQIAEKLDFDFGWRSGSPLRSQTCFQYRLRPLRATAVLKLSFSAISEAHTP